MRCLAASNLEDCDHFYDYYDLVETDSVPAPPEYEFPEYGPDTDPGLGGHGTGETGGGADIRGQLPIGLLVLYDLHGNIARLLS